MFDFSFLNIWSWKTVFYINNYYIKYIRRIILIKNNIFIKVYSHDLFKNSLDFFKNAYFHNYGKIIFQIN